MSLPSIKPLLKDSRYVLLASIRNKCIGVVEGRVRGSRSPAKIRRLLAISGLFSPNFGCMD